MVTQLTVTGSENGSSDDLVAQWPAFMHLHHYHFAFICIQPMSIRTQGSLLIDILVERHPDVRLLLMKNYLSQ